MFKKRNILNEVIMLVILSLHFVFCNNVPSSKITQKNNQGNNQVNHQFSDKKHEGRGSLNIIGSFGYSYQGGWSGKIADIQLSLIGLDMNITNGVIYGFEVLAYAEATSRTGLFNKNPTYRITRKISNKSKNKQEKNNYFCNIIGCIKDSQAFNVEYDKGYKEPIIILKSPSAPVYGFGSKLYGVLGFAGKNTSFQVHIGGKIGYTVFDVDFNIFDQNKSIDDKKIKQYRLINALLLSHEINNHAEIKELKSSNLSKLTTMQLSDAGRIAFTPIRMPFLTTGFATKFSINFYALDSILISFGAGYSLEYAYSNLLDTSLFNKISSIFPKIFAKSRKLLNKFINNDFKTKVQIDNLYKSYDKVTKYKNHDMQSMPLSHSLVFNAGIGFKI